MSMFKYKSDFTLFFKYVVTIFCLLFFFNSRSQVITNDKCDNLIKSIISDTTSFTVSQRIRDIPNEIRNKYKLASGRKLRLTCSDCSFNRVDYKVIRFNKRRQLQFVINNQKWIILVYKRGGKAMETIVLIYSMNENNDVFCNIRLGNIKDEKMLFSRLKNSEYLFGNTW